MQGEGQEFESPRLHHHSSLRRRQAIRRDRVPSPSPSPPHQPGTPSRDRAPDPCPPLEAGHGPADRWATERLRSFRSRGALSGASHLNNWNDFGRLNESSISPSSQYEMIPIRSQSATGHLVRGWRGSSYKGHGVDALAPRADEGRGRLRNAPGSREQTLIRRCPNGETRLGSCPVTPG